METDDVVKLNEMVPLGAEVNPPLNMLFSTFWQSDINIGRISIVFRLFVNKEFNNIYTRFNYYGRGDRTHIGHRPKLDSCIKNS